MGLRMGQLQAKHDLKQLLVKPKHLIRAVTERVACTCQVTMRQIPPAADPKEKPAAEGALAAVLC